MKSIQKFFFVLLCIMIGSLIGCEKKTSMISINREADFLLLLEEAEIKAPNPVFVHPAREEIDGVPHWGIFQHAPSTIRYPDLFIGEDAALDFAVGMLPSAWNLPGDGVRFRISAALPAGATQVLYSQYINPKKIPEHRKWIPQRIALSGIKNTTAAILFETLPGETDEFTDNNSDWAMWVTPKLTSSDRLVSPVRKNAKPNIVLITIDTLRADYLGCYGNTWIRTPVINALAAQGALFERNFAAISTTNPSHVSILTSLHPFAHGVISNEYFLADLLPRLPQITKELGYKNIAAISVYHLNSRTSGLKKWFDFYEEPDPDWPKKAGGSDLALVSRIGSVTTSAAMRRIEQVREEPFFLWVHYYDPHAPYMAEGEYHKMYYSGDPSSPTHHSMDTVLFPPVWDEGNLTWIRPFRDVEYFRKEYGAEISYVDFQIGRLLETLKQQHLIENTLIVLTADHGENLGDHDIYFDHWTLLNSDLHVPLIISYPNHVPVKRISAMASGIDIAPTILDLIGEKDNALAKKIFEGESLRPLWENPPAKSDRILSADGLLRTAIAGWDYQYKCVWELRPRVYHEKFRYHTNRVSIYDLEENLYETKPIGQFYWRNRDEKPKNPFAEEAKAQAQAKEETSQDEAKLKPKLNQVRDRAANITIPTPEELQSWFMENNGFDTLRDDLKKNPEFFQRIVKILQVLKERVSPPAIPERLKGLYDISSMQAQAAQYQSMQKDDPALKEYLKSLGYVSE